ncbi:Oncosphere antigen B [Taenia solium]|eukprot:TsM_001069200 transcript=TsM_001069200 gene=TsM_001069200
MEEKKALPAHFQWCYVGPQSMTLIWDARLLGVDYADEVRLTAVTTSRPPSLKSKRVDFSEERITLEELQANTRYEVFVDLARDEGIAEVYHGFIETPPTEEMEEGKEPFPAHFQLCYAKPHSVTLIWAVPDLHGDYADEIRLTAVPTSPPRLLKSRTANVLEERVTVDGLEANTQYQVFVDLMGAKNTTEIYHGVIKTPLTGKLASVIIMCITMPKDNASVCIGKDRGVVATNGSAPSSIPSGMAMRLA